MQIPLESGGKYIGNNIYSIIAVCVDCIAGVLLICTKLYILCRGLAQQVLGLVSPLPQHGSVEAVANAEDAGQRT